MYQFNRIFKMDLINLATNPMWIFYSTGFPLLLILIIGFLTSGSYGTEVTAYDYYGITMMIFTVLYSATISANSFMEERIKSGNMRIIHSPVPPFFLYFSKILASFVFTTICYTFAGIVLMMTVHVNFGGPNTAFVWGLLVLLNFFSCTLGVLLCCALKSESTTNQLLSMLITLLAVLGGLFFPLDGLGKAIEMISYLSPVKWISTAIFQLIYDQKDVLLAPTAVILTGLSALMILLSMRLFKREDYL